MGQGRRMLRRNADGLWVRVLHAGKRVLDFCLRCCRDFITPPSCGDNATCNDYCYPFLKAFYRSECCDCPCEGRTDFPRAMKATLTGATVRTDVFLDPGTGLYYRIDGLTVVDVTAWAGAAGGCTGVQEVFSEEVVCHEYSDAAGTIETQTFKVKSRVSLELGALNSPCVDAVGARWLIDVIPTGWNIGSGNFELTGPYNTVSRCTGGNYGGILGDPRSPSLAVVGTTVATVTIEPVCTDCDGTPVPPTTTDPASRCANVVNVYTSVFIGFDPDTGDPVYVPRTFHMTKQGPCLWTDGGDAQWSQSQGCPAIDTEDCDPGYTGTSSEPEWTLHIALAAGNVDIVSSGGSCPNVDNILSTSDEVFDNRGVAWGGVISVEWGEECP